MIFSPDMAAAITLGRKTVTRRPVKYYDGPNPGRSSRRRVECRYKVGRTYAVQLMRGGMAVERIQVVSVEQVRLGQLDRAEARLEGFSGPTAFGAKWRALYGTYDPETLVWRIEFALESDG